MSRAGIRTIAATLSLGLGGGLLVGCPPPALDAAAGTQVKMGFARDAFFDAPVPAPDLVEDDGHLSLLAWPNPGGSELVDYALGLWEQDLDGAGVNAGMFFTTDAPLPEGVLLAPLASVATDSPVQLLDVDEASPERGRRTPVEVAFHADGGPFGAPNLLSVIPLQGTPLRPHTRYALVVLRSLLDENGEELGASLDVVSALAGQDAPGWPDAVEAELTSVLPALADAGVALERIAAWTVLDTGAPVAQGRTVLEGARADHPPVLVEPPALLEIYPTFCVLQGLVRFAVFQQGTPPYHSTGGRWALDEAGRGVLQHEEDARLFITVPRGPVSDDGLRAVVFVRTGGGGDRPLIDRGVRGEPGGEALEPGTGPALGLSAVGLAGVMVDGPHGGLRNADGGDEQFLVFNFLNFPALRDNLRQSAVELALLPELIDGLALDLSGCPDVDAADVAAVPFAPGPLALMGHSMGATLAPMAAALEPRYEALVLSGAGGSWIENIVYKQSPVAIRPLAEVLLGYDEERSLHVHDPVLSAVQAGGDCADPLSHLRALSSSNGGPHVLMLQGIVDTYILPPIANATSLGLGLDLAGDALDEDHPELAAFTPVGTLLPLSGGERVGYPVVGNQDGRTRVVVQHPEDGVEDGHEVMFQTEGPKVQYGCFLRSFFDDGVPVVVDPEAGCE